MTQTPIKDSLLECLLLVAQAEGRPLNREAAVSGLPLVNGRMTPSLVARAASRAGLSCRMARGPLQQLADDVLPAILLLEGERAIVLLARDTAAATMRVRDPGAKPDIVDMPLADLEACYTGHAILLRPEFRFDARAPEIGVLRSRHWFWTVLRDNWPLYRDALKAALLINLFAVAMPLFVMNVYDRVVPNEALETLWMLAFGVAIVLVADAALRTMRSHFLDLAGNRVDVRLSAYIMERVLGLRLSERPVSAGSFAANLRSFEMVRDFITSATVTALIDVPFSLIFLLVMTWIAWPLAIPALVGAVLALLYAWSVQGRLRELTETTYRASALRNATLVESLVGLETIKSLGAEGIMQRKWEQSAKHLARVTTRLRLLSTTTLTGTAWIQQLVAVSVIVLGVYLIIDRQLSMGGLIAATMLSGRALASLGQVAALMTQYHNATTALASLDEIMSRPVERPADARFVSRQGLRGEIEFKDVSFSYPGEDRSALRGVSLRIRAGEKVAFLGRVGSGKSTLQKLILGLYQPTSGAVLIDGVDLRQLDPAELRHNIGYVPQDITLFYGTLRENLTMSMPGADDAALVRAAHTAAIDEFVNAHPRGFDMLVGERGETLSGGQRQGVAVARAVIGNPPIVLLDEPTGSMDHTSEDTVKQRLGAYASNRTLLIVTHRTSLLELAERLIVIDAGKIVADGPKDRVIAALRSGQIERSA